MGEVYRAKDTKLGREVAIKLLLEEVSSDPERMARFEREARVLASLNHNNIATLHGFEKEGNTSFLVMELVEGETLADRIERGAIPVDEALPLFLQIAEGLEAAHEQGVIHRDLKPANIKVTDDGQVKILDFGLAKAMAPEVESGGDYGMSQSPTLTLAATQRGQILGTASYMSPEQASGKPVDKRADIWAFGCVLYEMLTARRAFEGENFSATLAEVIRDEPSWEHLPNGLPPALAAALRRCLQKDPRQRIRDIGDVRLAMEGAFEPTASEAQPAPSRRRIGAVVALAVVALVVGVLMGRSWLPSPNAVLVQGLTRFTLELFPDQRLSGGLAMEEADFALQRPVGQSFAWSPDGRLLIYVASDGENTRLYRHSMDQEQATPIPGTEGGSNLFLAPDGRSVGFFIGGELKRVSIDGGEVRTISTTGPTIAPFGASWTAEDTILVSAGDNVDQAVLLGQSAIYEVSANGGPLSRLTTVESTQRLLHPELLPGGRALLYNQRAGLRPSEWDIVVESLDSSQRHVVVEGGSDPRYVASGHVVFARSGTLMAVPFDVTRLEVTGAPVVVVEDVMHAERGANPVMSSGAGQFSVSSSGSLAYVPGGIYPVVEQTLVWVDRDGASEPLPLPPGRHLFPRFSPDGTRLAYAAGSLGDRQIWVYDLALEVSIPLTSVGGNIGPLWSPDGTRLVFSSREGSDTINLISMAADGSGESRRLTDSEGFRAASSWSSGGVLAFIQSSALGSWDIMTLSMDGESEPEPFLVSPFNEMYPAFSPDGRWVAYSSDETGRGEVYVRPFPDGEPVHRVSTAGGVAPLWSSDGQNLFYRNYESATQYVMVVDVKTDPTFTRNQPRTLFEASWGGPGRFSATEIIRSYDLAPDGQRFVMIVNPPQLKQQPVTSIHVVLNWLEELKRLVPTD